MTDRLPFTEHSIRRLIKAARKEGLAVVGIRPDGILLTVPVDNAPELVPLNVDLRHTAGASRWGDE